MLTLAGSESPMWEQIKTKAVELLKKWWWAILGFIGGVILLLFGRPPKWEHNKVAEIKQREKEIEQAKEKAGNAEQTLQEVRKKHVSDIEDAANLPGRPPFTDADSAAEFIDDILRGR